MESDNYIHYILNLFKQNWGRVLRSRAGQRKVREDIEEASDVVLFDESYYMTHIYIYIL